jgi:hypothetical protein
VTSPIIEQVIIAVLGCESDKGNNIKYAVKTVDETKDGMENLVSHASSEYKERSHMADGVAFVSSDIPGKTVCIVCSRHSGRA